MVKTWPFQRLSDLKLGDKKVHFESPGACQVSFDRSDYLLPENHENVAASYHKVCNERSPPPMTIHQVKHRRCWDLLSSPYFHGMHKPHRQELPSFRWLAFDLPSTKKIFNIDRTCQQKKRFYHSISHGTQMSSQLFFSCDLVFERQKCNGLPAEVLNCNSASWLGAEHIWGSMKQMWSVVMPPKFGNAVIILSARQFRQRKSGFFVSRLQEVSCFASLVEGRPTMDGDGWKKC